jgi:hypothetical protein
VAVGSAAEIVGLEVLFGVVFGACGDDNFVIFAGGEIGSVIGR